MRESERDLIQRMVDLLSPQGAWVLRQPNGMAECLYCTAEAEAPECVQHQKDCNWKCVMDEATAVLSSS